MTDEVFLEKIYALAVKLKGSKLSDEEKNNIIEIFNSSKGTNYQRAKKAIEEITGKVVPEKFLILESAGAINNLQVLVTEMRSAAEKWGAKK